MKRQRIGLVVIGALTTVIATAPVQAQKVEASTPLSPGDLIQFPENNYPPNAIYKVVSCEPVGTPFRKCDMIRQSPDPETRARSFTLEIMRNDDVRVIGRAGGGQAVASPATGQPSLDADRPRPGAAPAPAVTGGTCTLTPYGGPVPGSRSASEALFRQKVADSYTMRNTSTFRIGVAFESFRVGSTIRNTVSNEPGVGAVRVNEGAPVGATMYPVVSRHVVCEQGGTNVSRRRVEADYYCFVTRDQEWTCASGGSGRPPRITPL